MHAYFSVNIEQPFKIATLISELQDSPHFISPNIFFFPQRTTIKQPLPDHWKSTLFSESDVCWRNLTESQNGEGWQGPLEATWSGVFRGNLLYFNLDDFINCFTFKAKLNTLLFDSFVFLLQQGNDRLPDSAAPIAAEEVGVLYNCIITTMLGIPGAENLLLQ